MKIRKKAPKAAKSGLPLYVIGFSFTAPSFDELKVWFDLEYGGPLRYEPAPPSNRPTPDGSVLTWATHATWRAAVHGPVSDGQTSEWASHLAWSHPSVMLVLPASGSAGTQQDGVLHAARLARGLTLLSHGTAYDVLTEKYLNPSDWQDRRLEQFSLDDHLTIAQAEGPDSSCEWFSTRGLRKFGLDELETFRPRGLPAHPAQEILRVTADVVLQNGRAPAVGSTVDVPLPPWTIRIRRHRTVALGGQNIAIREISWAQD